MKKPSISKSIKSSMMRPKNRQSISGAHNMVQFADEKMNMEMASMTKAVNSSNLGVNIKNEKHQYSYSKSNRSNNHYWN